MKRALTAAFISGPPGAPYCHLSLLLPLSLSLVPSQDQGQLFGDDWTL